MLLLFCCLVEFCGNVAAIRWFQLRFSNGYFVRIIIKQASSVLKFELGEYKMHKSLLGYIWSIFLKFFTCNAFLSDKSFLGGVGEQNISHDNLKMKIARFVHHNHSFYGL